MRIIIPLLLSAVIASASTTLPLSEEAEWKAADGVCRGRVVSVQSVAHPETGRPVTRAVIAVSESFRGKMPAQVVVEYPGGAVGSQGEDFGHSPALQPGEERLFFLAKNAKGTALTIYRGGAGAHRIAKSPDGKPTLDEVLRQRRLLRWKSASVRETDLTPLAAGSLPASGADVAASGTGGSQTASGLTSSASGVPARWLAPDRGEPIPYLVDLNSARWATDTDKAEALTAIENALAAWTAATGIRFRYAGQETFAAAAIDVTTSDETIRIQMHDNFGAIPDSNTIAIGGRAWNSTDGSLDIVGGGGGQVNGLEFHKAVRGYIVLRSTWPGFSNIRTVEETICHELGHVLGLSHSSESPTEANPVLKQAMMYYQTHADNRGATLGQYDPEVAQKAYPVTNTPPWSYARYMIAHVGPVGTTQTAPGVNEFTLTGYDRQDASALTMVTKTVSAASALFTFTGSKVKFNPTTYPTNSTLDPTVATYAKILYRYNDGTHCGPWLPISVIGYQRDNFPAASGSLGDGMPDAWMTTHFGSASATGSKRGPNDDFDSDGLTNLEEYRLGTNPTRGASRFDVTLKPGNAMEWLARPWSLYTMESSADGITWNVEQGIIPPAIGARAIAPPRDAAAARRFLRLRQRW